MNAFSDLAAHNYSFNDRNMAIDHISHPETSYSMFYGCTIQSSGNIEDFVS